MVNPSAEAVTPRFPVERRQRLLMAIVQGSCAVLIAVFQFHAEWTSLGASGWAAKLVWLAVTALIIYGFVTVLTAIAWSWVVVGILQVKPPPGMAALQPFLTVVLIVLAIVAFLF